MIGAQYEPKEITWEEGKNIIHTKRPAGKFYCKIDEGSYVAISNIRLTPGVHEFKSEDECVNWLKNER